MKELNRKIYYAFEKFFSAYRSRLWDINKKYSVSPIMIQFLKYISEHDETNGTVTNLALEYSLTKPTVSDAVNVLIKKGYLKRKSSKEDNRIKYLYLTPKGKKIITDIKEFENWFYSAVDVFHEKEKTLIYTFLIETLRILKQNGNIEILRSCILCENFEPDKFTGEDNPHFCNLLNIRMSNQDIKIDCSSNRPSESKISLRKPVLPICEARGHRTSD